LLTFWAVFLLASEIYGKKVACWAVGLLSLSALHALVSTSISFDGTFLAFYSLLSLYCFVKYERTGMIRWLIACGISCGLAVLTKYTGILVVAAIALYLLACRKGFGRTVCRCSVITVIAIAVFSIFPVVAFVFSEPSFFWVTLQHARGYFGNEMSIAALAIQYALALLWIGPLLLFGYFLSLKVFERRDWLFHSFVIVIFVFYTFVVQDPFRPVERYFSILLPALCIMSAKYFSQISLAGRRIKAFGIFFPVFLVIAFIINSLPAKILPFYPKTGFIKAILSLDWNFLVPFTGDQGPVGLYISFVVFAIAWIACACCFVLALLQKKACAVMLLAIGLALSVFMSAELALHMTSPNISSVVKETASYVKTSQLPAPFYTFRDYAMQYYIGNNATNIDFGTEPARLRLGNSTLVVVDFPHLDRESALWREFARCEQVHSVSSRGIVLGYVFRC
jgi:hypothetical protein